MLVIHSCLHVFGCAAVDLFGSLVVFCWRGVFSLLSSSVSACKFDFSRRSDVAVLRLVLFCVVRSGVWCSFLVVSALLCDVLL